MKINLIIINLHDVLTALKMFVFLFACFFLILVEIKHLTTKTKQAKRRREKQITSDSHCREVRGVCPNIKCYN